MSPRFKMLCIHTIIFLSAFLFARFLIVELVVDDTEFWITIAAVAFAWIIAPRPHVVQTQSGKEYGLKSFFSKKVFKM